MWFRVVYKLDIEKTYDHVNWSFFLEVMRKMGFVEKWRLNSILQFNDRVFSFGKWSFYKIF